MPYFNPCIPGPCDVAGLSPAQPYHRGTVLAEREPDVAVEPAPAGKATLHVDSIPLASPPRQNGPAPVAAPGTPDSSLQGRSL